MGLRQKFGVHDYVTAMQQLGVEFWSSDGVPTESGPAKGALAVDTTNGNLYINQGTASAATWVLFSALGSSISRSELSTAAASKIQEARPATVTTTGNTDIYMIVGETGTITSVDFSGVDALAAHDTNYVTFSITNLGQAGGGSTAILAATDANTTKATGGTALSANTKRSLTLHGTATNLDVTAGDRLRIRIAASGTLANTITFPTFCVRFGGTT